MKEPKKYTIKLTKSNRTGKDLIRHVENKTLEGLIEYFSYTLEVGQSYKKSINRNPKTIKSFVSNLNEAFGQKEGMLYSRTIVELV